MQAISLKLSKDNFEKTVKELSELKPNLICTFFSPSQAKNPETLKQLISHFQKIPVIGCSTAGEIHEENVTSDEIVVMAMKFEKTALKSEKQVISDASQSYEAAQKLAEKLKKDDLSAVLILAPGININGSEITKGFNSALGPNVTVFGGLAGDGMDFRETYTLLNAPPETQSLVAVGFYGESIKIGTGSKGGWSPFGPARRVTKSDANILYELDNKPALDLYKEYLQEKADNLPASGLLYPFAILDEDQSQTGLIRTILDVNHEEKSVILAGNLPKGSLVCLMHADIDELIDGAEDAAKESKIDTSEGAAILVSCVGRKIVMADDVIEEIEAVKNILGKKTPIIGFYSYGEISPFDLTRKTELHNQTMTVTHITET